MTKDKKDKIGKEQLLLEASRLGQLDQLEAILSQSQPHRLKKKTNPLARWVHCFTNIHLYIQLPINLAVDIYLFIYYKLFSMIILFY